MLKPEAMERVLIVAAKAQQPRVIETLHGLRAAHFVDFTESKSADLAEFRLGRPLPEAGPASERLVRVRALLRHLSLEGKLPDRALPVRDVEARLDSQLDQIEAAVSRAHEGRESLRTALQESRELETKLQPLASLPLRLEDYRGYDTLTVFVGRAEEGFEMEVVRAAPDSQVVRGEGSVFALFVPSAQASAVQEILYRHGFAEVEVPAGTGAPAERLASLESERAALAQRLAQADAELARLAAEHKDFLLAAEEHLAILVEKAEAPLSFGSTENAFVVDAGVPASARAKVEQAAMQATGGHDHFADLAVEADHHGHGHHDAGADAMTDAPAAPPESVPPTKYKNARAFRPFEGFTNLFSTPRYDEADPTAILALFFPLFFGFMIGDLGLGIVMALLGWLMVTKLKRVELMKELGVAFIVAGVIAMVFGGVVFQDAFGIPLTHNDRMLEEAKIDVATATCGDVYDKVHEATWTCLMSASRQTSLASLPHLEPIIHKVNDVHTMLVISLVAAGIHLLIGLLIGIRNEMGHGAKHLAAKIGFLVLLIAFYPAVLALLSALPPFLPAGQAYTIAGVGFVVGAIILGWAEGAAGVLEIPSMLSNILSYLRLGAVAIAKGAMAVAFNNLTLVSIGLSAGAGIPLLIVAFLLFLVIQALLFVLGVLSAGIQAIRLNFVEFFTKFFKGGGQPFKPFGRERQVTTPANSPSSP